MVSKYTTFTLKVAHASSLLIYIKDKLQVAAIVIEAY